MHNIVVDKHKEVKTTTDIDYWVNRRLSRSSDLDGRLAVNKSFGLARYCPIRVMDVVGMGKLCML